MIKTIRSILIGCATFLALGHVYYKLTGDFRLANVAKADSVLHIQSTDLQRNAAKEILAQPFSYLGHGNQTYVFISQDKKFVLKLFMNDYLLRDWWVKVIPPIPPFRQWMVYSGKQKAFRKNRLLQGYALAYDLDRENSGLVYVQYDSTLPIQMVVTLTDKLGMTRSISIDDYVFVIQSTVIPTKVELTALLKQGNIARAKERIRQLRDMYLSEYSKSLLDHDHNLIDNTGFIGEKAIRHDVGKVVFDERISLPENYKEDWRKIAWDRIDPWMESHFPQYRAAIAEELD